MTPLPSNAKAAKAARSVAVRRARTLREVREGKISVQTLLVEPPEALEGADLWDALRNVPKLGRTGIETLCTKAMVWPHRKLGELKVDEVSRLLAHLPPRCQ